MSLPSDIPVKDLVKVTKQYVSIRTLVGESFVLSKENTCAKQQAEEQYIEKQSRELQHKLEELQRSLRSCYKEISKVKLEIEHYFKFNLVEMQFTQSTNSLLEAVENNKEGTKTDEQVCQLGQEETMVCTDTIHHFQNSEFSFKSTENLFNPPSILFPEAAEQTDSEYSYINPYLFPSKIESWKDWNNHKPKPKSCGDVLKHHLSYPPDYILFGPSPGFIPDLSKCDSSQDSFRPHNYSVNSDKYRCQPRPCKSEDNNGNNSAKSIFEENEENVDNNKLELTDIEHENSLVKLLAENPTTEDLFRRFCLANNKSKTNDLKVNIASLIEMLKSRGSNEDDNIFDDTPLKIENSDLSCSMPEYKPNNIESFKKANFTNGNFNYRNNGVCPVQNVRGITNNYKNHHDSVENHKQMFVKPETTGNRCFNNQLACNYVFEEYPVKPITSDNTEVIYDKRSLIELFRKTELNHCSNSGSDSQESKSFSLWPVTANYMYVSNLKKKSHSNAVDREHPMLSSGKSLENELFPFQINNQIKRNEDYKDEKCSSLSCLNQTYVVNKCEVNDFNNSKNCPGYKNYFKDISKPEKNQIMPFCKGVIPKINQNQDRKQAMIAKYADYGEPFVSKSPNFGDNLDLFKMKGYDSPNNWNSFISIFTSKVGPTTRINHHKMFRRVINKIETDNMLSNVLTLTSNGGPFRLFDLNGYPLTDSTGNVLKDPYDKSVIHLDSTGLPKDDVKVFDSAGNTQNDINFDPTQKPNTNSIIIKLTNNFKRPLHLFDKYGRPLTDCYGKLLVNIHGRPLLRFDNFGRPITDYRGGPLYTDNGVRWSYLTDDYISNEQPSSETLSERKFVKTDGNKQPEQSCQPFTSRKGEHSTDDNVCKNNNTQCVENEKITLADIWTQVESVLQQIPRKKEIDKKPSQNSVIINSVSITQNPIENEFLKSIIFHENIVKQDMKIENNANTNTMNNNAELFNLKCFKNSQDNNKLSVSNQMNRIQRDVCLENYLLGTNSFPFHNNFLVNRTCSKRVIKHHPYKINPDTRSNKIVKSTSNFNGNFLSDGRELLSTNGLVNTSTCNTVTDIKKVLSSFTFKRHDYLNNLCNQILKNELDWKVKAISPIKPQVFNNEEQWTDTTYTSSSQSKYTDILDCNKSSVQVKETSKQSRPIENIIKEDIFDCHYKKEKGIEQLCKNSQSILNNLNKSLNSINKGKQYCDSKMEETKTDSRHTDVHAMCLKKRFPSPDEEATLSIHVLNKEDKHYHISVAERMINDFESNLQSSSLYDSSDTMIHDSSSEIKKGLDTKNGQKSNINYEKNNQHSKKQKQRHNDSLFRFPSEAQMDTSAGHNRDNPVPPAKRDSRPVENRELNNHMSTVKKTNRDEHRDRYETKHNSCLKNLDNKGCQQTQDKQISRIKKEQKQRVETPTKKLVPVNREFNLVSILGIPVKYVLNKLDNRRSLKQQDGNKMLANVKHIKNNIIKEKVNTTNNYGKPISKTKYVNGERVKTLYDNSKYRKKDTSSSNERTISSKSKDKYKHSGGLLAFKSKSCVEILNENDMVAMSYSGNDNTMQNKCSVKNFKDLPPSSTALRKCSSETNYDTQSNCPLRRCRKYDHPKHGKGSEHLVKRKYTGPQQSIERSSKVNRNQSTEAYPTNKRRQFNLFKKMEPRETF